MNGELNMEFIIKNKPIKKFQKGDLIILNKKQRHIGADKGATAKVSGYSDCGTFVKVMWVKDSLSKGQGDGGYYDKDFNLVERNGVINWKCRYEK